VGVWWGGREGGGVGWGVVGVVVGGGCRMVGWEGGGVPSGGARGDGWAGVTCDLSES